MRLDASKFPNIAFVADLLDMTLLRDLSGSEHDDRLADVVYAVGCNDMAAGHRGVVATPYFKQLALLEAFCREHRRKFEAVAEAETLPQKFFWELSDAAPDR